MQRSHEAYLKALETHDPRFDGLFFVGVTSTGIYCRPVCTARPPARRHLRFYEQAAQAEKAGFRPCLRCRPELAPGHAPVDAVKNLAHQAAARITAGALTEGESLESLAGQLGVTSRHLRRVMQQELGVSPIELAQTRRLLLAKQLLTETRLSITQVALSSGFESVRRFNGLFQSHYRLTPSTMRRASESKSAAGALELTLAYRPPYDWPHLLRFFAHRAAQGAECVIGQTYARTLAIGKQRGWLTVAPLEGKNALRVTLSDSLSPALPRILGKLRRMFDLDARPDLIASHLATDPRLAPLLKRFPGPRLPGAMSPFEVAARAIIGQRISVSAATTIASRFTTTFGEPLDIPLQSASEKITTRRVSEDIIARSVSEGRSARQPRQHRALSPTSHQPLATDYFPLPLTHYAPTPDRIASAKPADIRALGLTEARSEALIALAKFWRDNNLDEAPITDPDSLIDELKMLPGIGPWTASYIAMRAFQWPDAFPAGDLILCRAAGNLAPKQLEALSQPWRPWRAYAAILLWNSAK